MILAIRGEKDVNVNHVAVVALFARPRVKTMVRTAAIG